jgi:hypothetical protein
MLTVAKENWLVQHSLMYKIICYNNAFNFQVQLLYQSGRIKLKAKLKRFLDTARKRLQ